MIRKICLLLLGVISIAACSTNTIIDEMNKANQVLENRVKDNTDRIEALETLCSQMNSNISALKVLVDALQGQDWVKNVTPVTDGAGNVIGYTLEFSKSGTVVIYNGKDGRMERMALMERMAKMVKTEKTEKTERMEKTAKMERMERMAKMGKTAILQDWKYVKMLTVTITGLLMEIGC